MKKLPLVRLENGEQVCALDDRAFLPPENQTERLELAPFLGELPVVKSSLLAGEGRAAVEAFLKELGVKPLVPEEFILNWLLPRYGQDAPVASGLNLQHVRYLARGINRVSAGDKRKVCQSISATPLLQVKRASTPVVAWASPNQVYLPTAFLGNDDLELFFSATPTTAFVVPDYVNAGDDVTHWKKFFLEIGCDDLPRRFQNPRFVWDTKDWLIDGLEAALSCLKTLEIRAAQKLSAATWRLLIRSLPETEWDRDPTGTKQEHRSILNRAGVDRVLEYERGAGRHPTEMPHTHPGYDVESRNPSGEIERFIEVKSCPGDWDRRGVALTKTQFDKAIELGNRFWLYVVERAEAEDFNIIRVKNPGRMVNQFFYDEGWRVVGE